MYLYLKNRQDNLPKYLGNSEILQEFVEKVFSQVTNKDLEDLEKKLFKLYEDKIPSQLKEKILKNIN
jgi:hypothetical protein